MKIVLVLIIIQVTIFLISTSKIISLDYCLESKEQFQEPNRRLNYQIKLKKFEEKKLQNGGDVVLSCIKPYHKVLWHFLSCSNLHPENKWNLLEMNIQNDSIEHQLSLKNLTENNAGYYKCSAYNNVIQVYKLVIESSSNSNSTVTSNKDRNQLSYTEASVRIGGNFTIRCNETKKIILEFLPCFPNNNTACTDGNLSEKRNISTTSNDQNIKFYSKKIQMTNITNKNNGFYRCILNGKILKTYNVQVTNSKYDGPLPKILEMRSSKLLNDSYIIIKCKVYSELTPSINWLKESDEMSFDIKYLDKFYQSVNRSTLIRIPFQESIYYGEIKVKNIMQPENYVCVALTQFGKDYEILKIDIMKNNQEKENISLLLFLIPLPLILVPAIAWLCYFRNKKHNNVRIGNELKMQIPLVRKLKTVCGNK